MIERIVSCGYEVVTALIRCEALEGLLDGVVEVHDRAGGLSTQARLELSKGQFDRVEVGGVGGQVEETSASRLDQLADTSDLVGWQVVEHDRVTRLQGRDQGLLDIVTGADTPVMGQSKSAVAVRPLARSPAVTVMVFQCPNGTATRQRSPRGAHP